MKDTYRVPDVSCGHCKQTIESAFEPVPGVASAVVDIDAKTVSVDYDPAVVDSVTIVRTLESAGYPPSGGLDIGFARS
jgi:copper chaperone